MALTPVNRPAGDAGRAATRRHRNDVVLGSRGEREPATGRTLRPKQGR